MKPDDLLKLVEPIKKLVSEIFFSGKEPSWLLPLIKIFLFGVLILLAIWGLLFVLAQIKKIWMEQFWPLFYNTEQKNRNFGRKRVSEQILLQLLQLNVREEWKDPRFTELEAEVEAEGHRIGFSPLPFFQLTQRGLRREKSLSKALELSKERLILVEGEPGSGKSVALRHVAEKLAQSSMKSQNTKSIIPIYINLKRLERSSKEKIDKNFIESFVKKELNRINDRDIDKFLEEEFQQGIREGTWLFLFDSFDELPEVLSSGEADTAIRDYAEAIENFLKGGFNQCRGIIASRQFRGPQHLAWPRFRILPLESRRLELVKKAKLGLKIERELTRQLRIAPQEILEMTKNPMFLGIICEDMKGGNPFPKNTHSVFESYLEMRLKRDEDRLIKLFNLKPNEVRVVAERIAFCMLIDPRLGLSPTREGIQNAMNHAGFRVPGNFDQFLNALEYLKLARSDVETIPGEAKVFTFAHRRFQEYFATCVVLSDFSRINPRRLLSDGRWRETAVVIFQTQLPEVFAPILTEVRYILDEMLSSLSDLIDDPISYVEKEAIRKNLSISHPFVWPPGLLHLLGLLQDGFISRAKDLHYDIQLQVGRTLLSANSKGTLSDQKWSLEVAGITPQPILLYLLRSAFASDSQWLKEVAYRQTAKIGKIPNDIAVGIRKTLVSLFTQNRLPKEYFSTHAHLSRLDQAKHYINSLKLLRWVKFFDIFLHIILFLYIFIILYKLFQLNLFLGIIFITPFLVLLWYSYSSLLIFSSAISSVRIYFKKRERVYFLNVSGFDGYKIFKSLYPRLITLILPWACFAILASDTGQFTHPIWWIFLFAFPLLFFVFNPRKILRVCIYFLSDLLTYHIIFACLVLFFLSVSLDKLMNWVFINLNAIPVFFIYAFLVLFMIPFFLSIYYFLKLTLKFLNYWLQDWVRYRKWIKNTSSITSKDLLDLISLYHTKEACTRFIIFVRERNLLLVTEDSEQLIQELALELEHSLLLRNRNVIKRQRAVNIRKINTSKKWNKVIRNPLYITTFLREFKFLKPKKHLTEKMIRNIKTQMYLNIG